MSHVVRAPVVSRNCSQFPAVSRLRAQMDIYPDVFHELYNGGNIENIHDYAEFRINNLDKAIILNPGARHDLSSEKYWKLKKR